jgi:iron complex outermembrane recepter protein
MDSIENLKYPIGKYKWSSSQPTAQQKRNLLEVLINFPEQLPSELNGVEIFSHKERSLITNSRPKSKVALTADYTTDKFEFGLYNTNFGKVTIAHDGNDVSLDQELGSKLVTDFRLTYKFTPQLRLTGIMNNAFDVYPDVTNVNTGTTSGGSFLIF